MDPQSRSGPARRAALLALFAAVLCLAPAMPADPAGTLTGPQVKAWLVVNFVKYAEWPQARTGATTICVIGQDPVGPALAEFDGRTVAGLDLRVALSTSTAEASRCPVVYIGESEARRVSGVLQALSNHAVLTVSELDGFAEQGGIIGIVAADDRYQFDVNLDAARAVDIRLQTPMLRLARRVINTPRGH